MVFPVTPPMEIEGIRERGGPDVSYAFVRNVSDPVLNGDLPRQLQTACRARFDLTGELDSYEDNERTFGTDSPVSEDWLADLRFVAVLGLVVPALEVMADDWDRSLRDAWADVFTREYSAAAATNAAAVVRRLCERA